LVRAFKKLPQLIDRLDQYYPPPPPLSDIAVIEQKSWWGYALFATIGVTIGALLMLVLR
jgi:hypothetical protein